MRFTALSVVLLSLATLSFSTLIRRQLSEDECLPYNEDPNDKWRDEVDLSPDLNPLYNRRVEWKADGLIDKHQYMWSMIVDNDAERLRLNSPSIYGSPPQQFIFQILFYERAPQIYWLDAAKSCSKEKIDWNAYNVRAVYVFTRKW